MSLSLNFEPHSWYMGFAIKENENHTECLYKFNGTDTDGTEWYDCLEHEDQSVSTYAPCGNYDETKWSAFTDDGNTYRIVQFNHDTLRQLKQRIKEYRSK